LRAELAHSSHDHKRIFSSENLRKTLAPWTLSMTLTNLTGNGRGLLLLEKPGVLTSLKGILSAPGR
jgi:hypothetical protein